MKTKVYAFIFLFISQSLIAADSNYQDATPFIKQQMKSAAQETNNVTPTTETPGYTTSIPSQTSYYGGGTAVTTNIQDEGAITLSSSTVGQQVITTTQNNVTSINKDSSYIKAGTDAQTNAEVMTSSTQQACPQKFYKKSEFESHLCNKAFDTYDYCSKVASINGAYHWKTEEKTQTFVPSIIDTSTHWIEAAAHGEKIVHTNYSSKITFNADFTGNIKNIKISNLTTQAVSVDSTLSIKSSFLGIDKTKSFTNPCTNRSHGDCSGNSKSYKYDESFSNISKSVTAGSSLDITFDDLMLAPLKVCTAYNDDHGYCMHWKDVVDKPSVTVTYEIPKKIYDISVSWKEVCSFDQAGHQLIESKCTQDGGEKNFLYDGKSFEIAQDCWAYSNKYQITTASEGTCAQYANDPDCMLSKNLGCTDYYAGQCSSGQYKYQCQIVSSKSDMSCGGQEYYCKDGNCSDSADAGDPQFAQSVSALAALNAAASDISGDSVNMKAFTGRSLQCTTSFGGFNNCCKDSGWGQDAGLASCSSSEKELGTAKSKILTVKLGTKCTKKVLGVCLKKAEVYCVFDNKLSRIVQTQGRRDQLGIGFGSAGSPNCRGITINELGSIKFDQLDFSDFTNELNSGLTVPDNLNVGETIKQKVSQMVTQGSN